MQNLTTSQEIHILAASTASVRRQASIFMSTSAKPRLFQNTLEYFILVVSGVCEDSFIRPPLRRNVIVKILVVTRCQCHGWEFVY